MKVSVIVPAYNGERFIGETLDCLVNQTLKEIQIVVVNDGSTDSTQDVIDSYAEKDKRILKIYQPNSGVSAARNYGLEYAMGKYVLFLDSDDLLSADALEKMYDALEETGADLALCRVQIFGHGTREFNPFADELAREREISCYDKRLLRNFIPLNKCYRTKTLIESSVRFPAVRYSEDGAFFMEFVHTVKPKITGVFDAVSMYRKHPQSVTSRVNIALLKDFSRSMDSVYESALNSFEDAPKLKEDYLQEILYKTYSSLIAEFYRLMWAAEDDESLSFIGCKCDQIRSKMTDATKKKCEAEIKDIGKPMFSIDEICSKPLISVIVKAPTNEFTASLYAQSMPLFELITAPSDALPKKANIITDLSRKPKGKTVLRFSGSEVLDRRLFKVVTLLKRSPKFSFLPDRIILLGANLFLKLKR